MELRIEAQKQTLATRDESIRRLLEMLQSKAGVEVVGAAYADADRMHIERLNEQTLYDEKKIEKLENLLLQKDKEVEFLAQVRKRRLCIEMH